MKNFIINIFLFFSPLVVCAYNDPSHQFTLQLFDNRNGLSNSAVNSIFQDTDQLLWIATWDGLNLYDGTTFHVFNYNKDTDYKSIGNNVIQQIAEDKNRNIWISTIEGISRYNKLSGKFYNYFYGQHAKSKISEAEYQLAIDTSGTVFCLIRKQGLVYYDVPTNAFKRCPSLTKSTLGKILFDSTNTLWVLTKDGVLETYSHKDARFKSLTTVKDPQKIINFFYVNQRILYQTADGKLVEVNTKTLEHNPIAILPSSIKAITFYKEHYFVAWTNHGYGVYSENFKPSTFLHQDAQQMQNMKITSWETGNGDLLWAGTDGNGIIKIIPKTTQFGIVNTSNTTLSYNKPVRAFCKENGNLWIGTKGGGIIRIKNFKYHSQSILDEQYFSAPTELDNNAVYSLTKGSDNLIYIGSDGNGICLYDIRTNKFLKWTDIEGNDQYPKFGSVYAILQDQDQSVWLGTSGYGLIHLKLHRTSTERVGIDFLKTYTYNHTDSGPANDIIYALAKGDDDHLWVACRYGGLNLLSKKTLRFKTFKAFSYDGSLSHNDILSLYKDHKNRIWVGTSYGLNWIQQSDAFKQKPIFQKLTTANGLPNNTIHAIEEDSQGNIWVSTNKGLARINPERLDISHYQESDGLQSNEFSDGAVWKDKAGYLYFGGIFGLNFFRPKDIHNSTFKTNLLVSSLQLAGKNQNEYSFNVIQPSQPATTSYTLTRNEGFFEMQCKAINYINAEKCEYAYYLENYDKNWNYAGTKGRISYQNLPPGEFTLKIRWSNGEGIWTQDTEVFNLVVKQYFWITLPAFFLYFFILSTTGYVFYISRKNKLRVKYQLAMEQIMREKEEELHQKQLNFFTNITHELQTPLTLIMGTAEHFLKHNTEQNGQKQIHYFLSTIHKQAARLTYLVEQLLEFRKAEAGHLENRYTFSNVSEMLQSITGLFIPLSMQHHMNYNIHIQPNIIEYIDKDKLEKILFNLLSNAFKYSGQQENICFIMNKNEKQNTLEISVSNTGCTVSEEQLGRLFDRFYTGTFNGVFGTGVGLAFTQQLVHLLNGIITVSSENNQITFRITIPLQSHDLRTQINKPVTTDSPYLYESMLSLQTPHPSSPIENNKQAILESLQHNKRPSILLVEDEAEIRYLLKNILKNHYIIYEAENGVDALDMVKKVIPDMIISDIMMPAMNGLDLCSTIKNTPATCHIAFIILSAKDNIEHRTEGYEVGADAYVTKPFHTDYLLVRIRKLLEYKQSLHDLFNDNATIDFSKTTIIDVDRDFLDKLIKTIQENMDAPNLNAASLEDAMAMSKMQLYRKLKTMTNMTPGEFIKHIRLKHAAHLLESTQLNVSEIYYCTGFNNQSYFFREFKKRYQCAPNEYRAKQQFGILSSDAKIS